MAHFNKRHYEAIAETFQECRKDALQQAHHAALDNAILEFAAMFERDNRLFDGSRFVHACKPGSNVKAKTAHLKVAS
jgi:hypothetical protein